VILNLRSKKQKVEYTDAAPDLEDMMEIFTDETGNNPKELAPSGYRVYVNR